MTPYLHATTFSWACGSSWHFAAWSCSIAMQAFATTRLFQSVRRQICAVIAKAIVQQKLSTSRNTAHATATEIATGIRCAPTTAGARVVGIGLTPTFMLRIIARLAAQFERARGGANKGQPLRLSRQLRISVTLRQLLLPRNEDHT